MKGPGPAPVSQRLTAQQAAEPQGSIAQFLHTFYRDETVSQRLTALQAAEPLESGPLSRLRAGVALRPRWKRDGRCG